MNSIDKDKEIVQSFEIYSEKFNINGVFDVYKDLIKLSFDFQQNKVVLTNHKTDDDPSEFGLKYMEVVLERLNKEPEKAYLHYWYLFRKNDMTKAYGIVTGHHSMWDTEPTNTTAVVKSYFDRETEEMIVRTLNTEYHCPMRYCNFQKQDEFFELIENYEQLKEIYKDKIEYPEIEKGKVLLVLSDFDEYFFHSLCVKDENGNLKEYAGSPHLGMITDSFLIITDDMSVDIRYYVNTPFKSIRFYSTIYSNDFNNERFAKWPLYIENIGSSDLNVDFETKYQSFRLAPGERKKIT